MNEKDLKKGCVVHYTKKSASVVSFLLGFFLAASLTLGGVFSYVLFCPHFKAQVAHLRESLMPLESNVTLHIPPPKLVLVPVPSKTSNFSEATPEKPAPNVLP